MQIRDNLPLGRSTTRLARLSKWILLYTDILSLQDARVDRAGAHRHRLAIRRSALFQIEPCGAQTGKSRGCGGVSASNPSKKLARVGRDGISWRKQMRHAGCVGGLDVGTRLQIIFTYELSSSKEQPFEQWFSYCLVLCFLPSSCMGFRTWFRLPLSWRDRRLSCHSSASIRRLYRNLITDRSADCIHSSFNPVQVLSPEHPMLDTLLFIALTSMSNLSQPYC